MFAAQRERRLPHRRARGGDDQVAGLEAGREPVEVAEAGRSTGQVGARLVQLRDPLEALLQQLLDVRELAGHALLRQVEHEPLGMVDEFGSLALALPAEQRDSLAGLDQAAERRHLADDAGPVGRVRRRGDDVGQLVQPDPAASTLELAGLVEVVGDRDRVDGLAARVQVDRALVDLAVAETVEVARPDDLDDRGHRARGHENRPEEPLFRVEVLRRDVVGRERGDGCELGHAVGFQHPDGAASSCRRVPFEHVLFSHLQGNCQ
jgi:hypothetical protein